MPLNFKFLFDSLPKRIDCYLRKKPFFSQFTINNLFYSFSLSISFQIEKKNFFLKIFLIYFCGLNYHLLINWLMWEQDTILMESPSIYCSCDGVLHFIHQPLPRIKPLIKKFTDFSPIQNPLNYFLLASFTCTDCLGLHVITPHIIEFYQLTG